MKVKLVVTRAGGGEPSMAGAPPLEHAVSGDGASIGRAPENDVVLPDPEKRVSSKHARLERHGESWFIVDLGSKNGTFVGEQAIEPHRPVPLQSGTVFTIEDFEIRFLVEEVDLERTVGRRDPSRLAAEAVREIELLYARHAEDPPEKRARFLGEALRTAIAGLQPEDARTVCTQVRARFESGEPRRTGPAAGRDAEISRQEALYRAGFEAIQAMSSQIIGDASFERAEQVEAFGRLVAQAILVTAEWLSRCLKGRREFEKQFSAELTLIFSREGNPIKDVETNPEAIARFLLDWRGRPDAEAARTALEGAFKDLTLHQLALISGVQGCLRSVLERLDPSEIEKQARAEAKGLLSGLRVKLDLEKCAWRQYVSRHGEMFQENSKLFNELIYPNIRKGYLAAHAAPGTEDKPPKKG